MHFSNLKFRIFHQAFLKIGWSFLYELDFFFWNPAFWFWCSHMYFDKSKQRITLLVWPWVWRVQMLEARILKYYTAHSALRWKTNDLQKQIELLNLTLPKIRKQFFFYKNQIFLSSHTINHVILQWSPDQKE